MGQNIDLFKISNIQDKNNKREYPKNMGKKENWDVKLSKVNYKKKNPDFEEQVIIVNDINENINE